MLKEPQYTRYNMDRFYDKKTTDENGNITYYVSKEKLELKHLQEIVGGYIEVIFRNNKMYIVDEEGLLKNYTPNISVSEQLGYVVVGNIVVLSDKALLD